jgi:hypothetical protein
MNSGARYLHPCSFFIGPVVLELKIRKKEADILPTLAKFYVLEE